MKKIAIMGSTGSIGTQTLDVVRENKDIEVVANGTVNVLDGEGISHRVRVAGTLDLLAYDSNGNKVDDVRQFNVNANVNASLEKSYVFKRGIQVIELDSNVSSISIHTDKNAEGILIFSEWSLVKWINPKFSYQFDSLHENDALATLLADIQKAGVADTFYYNAPIDNENAIDLNNNLANETLLTPESWYDPNNVNNKFVVSEISADDLLTGITLSKASRL